METVNIFDEYLKLAGVLEYAEALVNTTQNKFFQSTKLVDALKTELDKRTPGGIYPVEGVDFTECDCGCRTYAEDYVKDPVFNLIRGVPSAWSAEHDDDLLINSLKSMWKIRAEIYKQRGTSDD